MIMPDNKNPSIQYEAQKIWETLPDWVKKELDKRLIVTQMPHIVLLLDKYAKSLKRKQDGTLYNVI